MQAVNRRFAWLLWLAMLLPLAQLAGAAHELSHVERVRAGDGHKTLHLSHCDICSVAAAVTAGGGAASHAPVFLLQAPAQVLAFAGITAAHAVSHSPYFGRAPPAFLP